MVAKARAGGLPPGKMAVAAMLACGLFVTIGLFSPGLVLPQIGRAFAGTPHAPILTEMIAAVAGFSFALGAPLWGMLVGKVGCQRVILPGLLLVAICGTLPLLLNDLWLIIVSRAPLGLATSAIFTGALAGIGAQPEIERARLFGWFAVVGGVAAILLFPIVGMLGHIHWRFAFLVHLSSLAIVPLAWTIPSMLGRRADDSHQDAAVPRPPLLNRSIAGVLAIACLAGMSMMLSPIYGPLYLASLGVTDTRFASIPLTIGAMAAVLASALYGNLHRRVGVAGIFLLSSTLMGVALLIAGSTGNVIVFTAAMAGMSAMVALLGPNLNTAAVAYSAPARTAQAIGLANGIMFGAQLLFPFIASWVRVWGGLSGVFAFFGLIMLAVAMLVGWRRVAKPGRLEA